MIGVVDYGGSPLFVLPTPGTDKPTLPVDCRRTVDIDEAGPDDPFLWENSSTRIFPGFYDTYIGMSNWIDEQLESDKEEIQYLESCGEEVPDYYLKSWEDFDERYESKYPNFYVAYEDIVCNEYVGLMWDRFQIEDKDHIITSMQYHSLWSPAYYNFETDKLTLRLTCDFEKLESWIQEHLEEFRKYLHDVWSSYDGFISFVPNTYEGLVESRWYRKICLEYYVRTLMMYERESDDEFYDSVEYNIFEWLIELSPEEVAARAKEMEGV